MVILHAVHGDGIFARNREHSNRTPGRFSLTRLSSISRQSKRCCSRSCIRSSNHCSNRWHVHISAQTANLTKLKRHNTTGYTVMRIDLLNDILNLFFPNCCIICNKMLTGNEIQLCLHCINDIPRTNFHLLPDNPVEKRFWGKVKIEKGTSYFYFRKGSSFQSLMHALKYKGNQQIGIRMGKYAAAELHESGFFTDIDYIVPVPLHPQKLRKRGYNQSERIAQGVSEITNLPIDITSLIRTNENATQTRKSIFERFTNTSGIFKIENKNTLINKHILLIDDVLTTGSTLEACIHQLQSIQGIKVSILTLAIA